MGQNNLSLLILVVSENGQDMVVTGFGMYQLKLMSVSTHVAGGLP